MSEFCIFQPGPVNNNKWPYDVRRSNAKRLQSQTRADRNAGSKEIGMIVTIDGPAGAGKSSVAKKLADALGFAFLDTGAMYRCVTLQCLERGVDLNDAQSIVEVARNCKIEFHGKGVFANGIDVTDAIRDVAVSSAIKFIADNTDVRELMVKAQQTWAVGKDAVTEGRDQGTVVFPAAECKIFLTASAEERAARRCRQLLAMNKEADYESILAAQKERDQHDTSRPVGGLVAASDALHFSTDTLSEDQVLERLISIVRSRQVALNPVERSQTYPADCATQDEPEVGNGVA
jgi:cytidylate kinase